MNKKGFTLIELLIVVAIIAILAAIAVPNFLEAQTRAKVARSVSDLRTMSTAMEEYKIDYNKYSLPSQLLVGNFWGSTREEEWELAMMGGAALYGVFYQDLTSPIAYISSLPEDNFKEAGFGVTPGSVTGIEKGHPWMRYTLTTKEAGGYGWFDDTMYSSLVTERHPDWINKEYIFAGLGPDRSEDIFSPWTMAVYDATNGTISAGDIVRLGP